MIRDLRPILSGRSGLCSPASGAGCSRCNIACEMGSKIALAILAVVSMEACAMYQRESRSIPVVGSDSATVHPCRRRHGQQFWPPSGGELCFVADGIDVSVEAMNEVPTSS